MKKTLKTDVTSNNGAVIPAGSVVEVSFPKQYHGTIVKMTFGEKVIKGRVTSMPRYFGTKMPSMKMLQKWTFDSVCKSVGGKTVEPDGWDENGTPSWLLALGMI